MKTITIPGFIYAKQPEDWEHGDANVINGVSYRFTVYDLEKQNKVCPVELTFTLPEKFNPIDVFVAELKAERQKAMADFQSRITEIDRQINQLLAIEN